MRVLGLDPGLRATGWGVIDVTGQRLGFVDAGTVKTPTTAPMAHRLADLHRALVDIAADFAPDEAAVEETFVNRNPASALKLGQARGAVLLVPGLLGIPVAEYSANHVKKSVCGSGHASKEQISAMVAILLPGFSSDSFDAADALAVAICHTHHSQSEARIEAAELAMSERRA
jgi:crossover junction endodeoxyribonuclease RuvC